MITLMALMACSGPSPSCPSGFVWDESALQCFAKDADADGWADLYDCDDSDAAVHPGAAELCDGIDNDCNDLIDDEDGNVLASTVFYADQDGDGFAGTTQTVKACEKPEGYYATAGDCDDVDRDVWPGAEELCDGLDNDCDGEIEDEEVCADSGDDGDFYGDITITSSEGAVRFCEHYSGTVYGTLTLAGYGLTELSDVSCIEQIYGSLAIDLPNAPVIEMPALTLVDGDIEVLLYEGTTLVGFSSLSEAGLIDISYGAGLESLDLSALQASLGLVLVDLPSLQTLSLPAVTDLGLLYSAWNTELSTVELPSLVSLGELEVWDNDELVALDLSTVTELGDVSLYSNESLSSLDLSGAGTMGQVLLDGNPSITSLDLDAATSLGGLVLRQNDDLTTVTWAGIDSVGGDVIFYDNPVLDLPDHSNIVQVDGDWGLWYSNTTTLDDLGSLEALLGDLYLVDNGLQSVDLSSISQLGGLYLYNEDLGAFDLSGLETPLSGNFTVAYNYDLDDFGWPEFGDLEGDFVWTYNGPTEAIEADTLTSVSGGVMVSDASWGTIEEVEFDSLESVGGSFQLEYLDSVDRLDLSKLEEVGGSFRVYYSDYIEQVDLSELVSVGGDFYLYETGFYADDFDLEVSNIEEIKGTVYLTYLSYYGGGSDIDLDFAALEQVSGGFYVRFVNGYYGGDVTLSAPLLTSIGSSLQVMYNGRSYNQSDRPGDVEVDLSSLETLGGSMGFYYNGYGSGIGNGSSSGNVEVDLSALRSANGSVDFSYNGYCNPGSNSWHCYAGDVALYAGALESIGNSSVVMNQNGMADYGEGGSVTIDLASLTTISGNLQLEQNGYARGYRGYSGQYPYGGDVDLIFTDLETVGSYMYLNYCAYGYDAYYGNYHYGQCENDFGALREVYYLYVYRTGLRDFDDWGALETISASMYIQYNTLLTNADGLEGGDFVDYMYIYGNTSLGNSRAYDVYYSWSTVNSYNISNN